MEYILQTENLTKKYGEHIAVNNLNIKLKRGEIYGFLGENGAGKTTTIRMIMGLIKPSAGNINLFGENFTLKKPELFRKIGSIIEFPGFYSNLTAKENLYIHKKLMGLTDDKCIENALSTSGILYAKDKKVKDFSLGMKQRLGIARALLHGPELLILDEPTNGLDPSGIKEIRELLLTLAKEKNITVLISSHILSEIENLATNIGIIHKGCMLEQCSMKELENKKNCYIKLNVNDSKKAAKVLKEKLHINNYNILNDKVVMLYEPHEMSPKINKTIIDNSIELFESSLVKNNLEDYFMGLIGGNSNA